MLHNRLTERWTLDSLAAEVHLSRSQLVHAFETATGVSPMAYLRQLRIQRMTQLLSETELLIAEVARSVGWKDANYASRRFRHAYGISPTEFRRRQIPPPRGS